MENTILPDFQKFLLSRGFAPPKNVPFYANWVSKFIAFSNRHEELNDALLFEKFLDKLKSQKNTADWQIRQARNAVQLYITHFMADKKPALQSGKPQKGRNIQDLSKIVQEMRKAIRIKHYSYSTERTYIDWVKRFFDYTLKIQKKDITTSGLESSDVRDYLSYLAMKRHVSSSTQNQAFNALLFLFREILRIGIDNLSQTIRAKRGQKLPVVLSVEEVQEILKHVEGTDLLILQLLYGSGLRLMELARLRVKDIDFGASLILVRNSKGDKDRATMLPEFVTAPLRSHLDKVKIIHEQDLASGHGEVFLPDALGRKYPNAAKEWGWQYIFPSSKLSVDPRSGRIRRHHIHEKTVQNAVKEAIKKAGIAKHASVHTLRHSFATHLLMNGVNIREIQNLLGHKHVETTMIYTHVVRDMVSVPKSPLDNLYNKKPLQP
jgi:integron integrase